MVFIFFQGAFLLRSTILLLGLNHTLKYRHAFLHTPIKYMELVIFVAHVFQDLIVVLSDVIEYNCLFYTGFRRLATFQNTATKLADNEVGSTVSWF